ncbi:uncharacterized protein ISCGN_016980 [Ixodes scapularis]
MERLQTKRLVTRAEIEHLGEEIQAAVSIEDFRPHHEERLAEITDNLDALARELKEQDALIEVHLKSENLAKEYRAVRETQSLFRQQIYNNIELSGVEKFLYLRTVLTGKAAAAVSGIQAAENCYAYAVELLKWRFRKKDVLVLEHLTQLLNLPKVKALSDVGAPRLLHDHAHRNIASLRTFGVDSDSYGAMLFAALLCGLPAEWAVDFYKSQSSSNETPESSNLGAVLRSMRLELDSRKEVYDGSTRDQTQPLKRLVSWGDPVHLLHPWQVHLAMQRWVLPRSQICLLRQSLQFRLLRPSLLLRVLYRGLFLDLFLELFLELSLGLPLFLGALLLFPRGISGLSGLFLRLRSGLSLSLYSGLFLRPRSGLSLSLVPVLFRPSGLFLGPWLLLLRTLCQGHHQSPWLQSNYLSPIWQFAQTHGQNCSFCRRQKRVRHLCLHLRIQWKNSRPSSTHHPRSPSHLQLLYHQRGKVGQYAREDFR